MYVLSTMLGSGDDMVCYGKLFTKMAAFSPAIIHISSQCDFAASPINGLYLLLHLLHLGRLHLGQ